MPASFIMTFHTKFPMPATFGMVYYTIADRFVNSGRDKISNSPT